eukprot:513796-Rhodomonas_salina.3
MGSTRRALPWDAPLPGSPPPPTQPGHDSQPLAEGQSPSNTRPRPGLPVGANLNLNATPKAQAQIQVTVESPPRPGRAGPLAQAGLQMIQGLPAHVPVAGERGQGAAAAPSQTGGQSGSPSHVGSHVAGSGAGSQRALYRRPAVPVGVKR